MYLGMAVTCLGVAIAFESTAGAVAPLVAGTVINLTVIPREEAYMQRTFGRDYSEYQSQVRRWLGRKEQRLRR